MKTQQELIDILQETRSNLEKYFIEQNEELLKKAIFGVILVSNNLKKKIN